MGGRARAGVKISRFEVNNLITIEETVNLRITDKESADLKIC